jgi:phenylacetate-CoA ligase
MYPKLTRYLFYPLLDLKKGSKTLKYLKELNKTQWLTRTELEAHQNKKLRSLIKHAYRKVPYYHKVFRKLRLKPEDVKNKNDLLKLPILTKSLIRKNYQDLIAQDFPEDKYYQSSTGGSTGAPLQFVRDRSASDYVHAAAYRSWQWTGWKLGDRYANLWGASKDLDQAKKFRTKLKQAMMNDNLLLSSYDMTENNLNEYIDKLKKFNPKFIRGYASAIYLLAKYMKSNNKSELRPKAIITTSENLFDHQRELIEEQFDCKIFDGYGCRENSVIATECEAHEGYHISVENGIIECVKNNKYVSYGEMGEMYLTDFNNYSMPFIRYQVGDLGTPSDQACSCGRGLPMLESIDGRTTDLILTPSGNYVAGPGLTLVIKDVETIEQLQIIQESKDELLVKVVKGKGYTDKDQSLLIKNLHKYISEDIKIQIQIVDEIPAEPSGKQRFVISKVPIEI